jgi:Eukaryotic aspartyl protease
VSEDSTGTVLFGGYDSDKYSGQLTILEIYPDAQSGIISSMTVAWTSLSVSDSSGTTLLSSGDFPLPAVLDSGTTLTVIPSDMYNQLANYFEAVSDRTYGVLVACSIGSVTGSLDFGFGGSSGPIISVSFSELAIPAFNEHGNPLTFEDGSAACTFGLDATTQGEPILLGDTFLRSAYVVYDLDSKQIGIAPTVFNTTSSNIVEIGSGNVAGASSIATGASVEQTATANLPPGLIASGSATASLIQTTVQTGGVGSITGVETTKPVTGSTTASTTASITASAATATKNTAATLSPAFDLMGVLVVSSSFVMMLLGGAFVVFN